MAWPLGHFKLQSVNSNFTLAVHSPKLDQAKTHYLSHIGEKKRKNMARPGFEPTITGCIILKWTKLNGPEGQKDQ